VVDLRADFGEEGNRVDKCAHSGMSELNDDLSLVRCTTLYNLDEGSNAVLDMSERSFIRLEETR
jgi:hypothetical protein